jgi:hypothetical protein
VLVRMSEVYCVVTIPIQRHSSSSQVWPARVITACVQSIRIARLHGEEVSCQRSPAGVRQPAAATCGGGGGGRMRVDGAVWYGYGGDVPLW